MEFTNGKIIRYGDAVDQIGMVWGIGDYVVEGTPLIGGHFCATKDSCSEASEADVERWNAAHNDGTAS